MISMANLINMDKSQLVEYIYELRYLEQINQSKFNTEHQLKIEELEAEIARLKSQTQTKKENIFIRIWKSLWKWK